MSTVVLTSKESGAPTPVPGDAAAGIALRLLEPGESSAVLAVFSGLGERSRELRFLAHKPRLTNGEVRALTAVDARDHVAVLATSVADGTPVGIARFVRSGADTGAADVAVAVVDAWQRRGVATAVLRALTRRAAELGVCRFRADVATDNVAVLHLLRRSGVPWSRVHVGHGVAEVQVSLDGAVREPFSPQKVSA